MLRRLVGVAVVMSLVLGVCASGRAATGGIWLTAAEIQALPTSGSAWNAVKAAADGSLGAPDLADYNSNHDVRTLAAALAYVRTGDPAYRQKAADAIMSAIGTEDGGQAVTLGRNLVSYVIAADLIDFQAFDPVREGQFRSWLDGVRREVFSDGSLVSNDEQRANNHGRVAGASRVAVAAYLNDVGDLARTAQVFQGFLGDRAAYAGFKWNSDLSWQVDPSNPVGVDPVGAVKDGHAIDGALPEEMRRGCSFRWPPCLTRYPWGALQGALVEAEILFRRGYDAFEWRSRALRRAVQFVRDLDLQFGGWWATGDDTWQPWFVNFAYGTSFPTSPAAIGKTMGWTDWTHARTRGGTGSGNTAPVCSAVTLSTPQDTPGEATPACSDADLDPLTFEIVSQGAKGVASVVGGLLRYQPSPGATGGDTFTYRALDGTLASNVASVSVTIAPAGGGGGGGSLTLLPDGDVARGPTVRDKSGGVLSLFSSVDERVAAADDGTSYVRNDNRQSGSYTARLSDTPAGFVSMTAISVSVRARTTGRIDDTTALYAQVLAADGVTPLTAEALLATNPGVSAWTTIANVSLPAVAAGSKALWDGAVVRLRWQFTPVGSPDTTQLRLTAVELGGTSA